jgi:hypothetical protein
LYGYRFLRLGLGCVKASSASVSLGLLSDLWPRESPDRQSESASAHVDCIFGRV